MFKLLCVLLLIIACSVVRTVQYSEVPHIACPQYFQYMCHNKENCFGKITLDNIQLGTTTVKIKLAQRHSVQSNYGKLSLYEDINTTYEKVKKREPISYRVTFPYSNILPKLTQLTVADVVLCESSGYSPPSTTLTLQHTLKAPIPPNYQKPQLQPLSREPTVSPSINYRDKGNPFLNSYVNTPQPYLSPSQNLDNYKGNPFLTPNRNKVQQEFTTFGNFGDLTDIRFSVVTPQLPSSQQSPILTIIATSQLKPEITTTTTTKPQPKPTPTTTTRPQPKPTTTTTTTTTTPRTTIQPQTRPQTTTTARPTVPIPSSNKTRPEIQEISQPGTVKPTEPLNQNISQVSCGREGVRPAFVPYIHGGTLLRPGQFPWLTAIYHKSIGGVSFICGGSLISARTILSAAHCFRLSEIDADRIMVSLGRYNLISFSESNVVTRDIKTLLVNPEYDPNMFPDADIALLIMTDPVSFTEFISPVCLWDGPVDANSVVNVTGYVAGWGGENSKMSSLPKMAPANIVSDTVCRRSSDLLKILSSSRTLCAGQRDGVGPCMGDSGAGLMIPRNGVWYLRGVVSAGASDKRGCNLWEYVVYCDMAKFRDWVHLNML